MCVLHIQRQTNRRQTEIQKQTLILILPPSLTVYHGSLCFHPAGRPSLQSCVDIRLVQKGSAQLIAGPLGVGGVEC